MEQTDIMIFQKKKKQRLKEYKKMIVNLKSLSLLINKTVFSII